jgi:hypothetical protein
VSTIEERLARDIAAVTGGIIVSESDLREAREEFDVRVKNRRQRDRRVVVAAAAAAALVVGVVGWQTIGRQDAGPAPVNPVPSPPPTRTAAGPSTVEQTFLVGDAPTAQDLLGVWRLDNGERVMSMAADGTIRLDDTGRLFSEQPAVLGTYALDGDLITLDVSDGLAGCGGQSIVMRASVPEPGILRLFHREPGTGSCTPEQNGQWVMERVLPQIFGGLSGVGFDGTSWRPPAGVEDIIGDWFPQGGGAFLEVLPQGQYLFIGGIGDVVDRGRWSVNDARTRLTLESGSDSPTCREGDRFVLASLGALDNGAMFLSSTIAQNDCGGAWAKDKWIRLAAP